MTYDNKLLKKFNLTGKVSGKKKSEANSPVVNMMTDPAYLRQSSALINDALQKGFDVLQLANGDIVTTGTKTVVYQYTWNDEKGKLIKTKPENNRKSRRPSVEED